MKDEQVQPPANVAKPANELAPFAGLAEGHPPATRDDRGRFLTGNNGGGRPKGAKNRLTELFLSVVVADFNEHGAEAIARMRTDDPTSYLRMIGALVPRELILQQEQLPNVDYAELTYEEVGELADAERKRQIFRRAIEGY